MAQTDQQRKGNFKNIDTFLSSVYFSPKNNQSYPSIKKGDVDNILVIGFFLTADAIHYIPALKVIKMNFPHARVAMVCPKAVQNIIREQQLVDDFFVVKRLWGAKSTAFLSKLSSSFAAIKAINQTNYDLTVDFTGDWRAIFFMNFIKSERKISYNAQGGSYMLTDPVIPKAEIDHITDEAFYLLKEIGCEFTHKGEEPVIEHMEEQSHDFINDFKAGNKLGDKFVIGVFPCASASNIAWEEENYAELVMRLAINYSNCIFIIFGGPDDKPITAKIGKILKHNNIIDYLVVNRPLPELIPLGGLSRLIICNDANAAQTTAAYNLPALIIFGKAAAEAEEANEQNTKKFIRHNLELPGKNSSAEGITVEQVYYPAIDMINSLKI